MACAALACRCRLWLRTDSPLRLYLAALGVLAASKAKRACASCGRSRLLPPRISLVKANSRMTLSGLLATAIVAPIGGLRHVIGPAWRCTARS